ncbi:polyhydroxyalkanoate synthesis repressor PhaR [Limibaculum sp. FT325]|uniref:polyhydroxyalkanoate synthesis repressor PhaR n=1 Tax=Thermohalobaculum sediminis TaxID=2939436 RepID=UPI0020C04448|nr:polyhydroxyalkanoate synthesis repressor PhaR [Limibaculum sediminis]MCL5777608.1 polyhydroxyalkanoate synthesis repressor PhaR [Limibaculum sediminis]
MSAAEKEEPAATERVIIKKYANRRLYNTARSSYVTLDDLAKMVREGQDFAVFDAKTGEDITRSVLTQIIFEEEAKGRSMLPTNFLRQLIRLYGDALQSVVPGYLDASMDAFAKNQERMRAAFAANPAMQNFEALTRSNMEFFEQAMRMFNPFGAAQQGRGGAEGAPPQGPRPVPDAEERRAGTGTISEDLDALQRQLREMQAQLEKLTRGKG